ncbi:uncharacterized protein [Engystomops pustulosus]|uniref:uncharacterized protein isoform X3 n=1 Tax=Engystomops pustulosus TaxID=76066 RepID=UPI003AFB43EE
MMEDSSHISSEALIQKENSTSSENPVKTFSGTSAGSQIFCLVTWVAFSTTMIVIGSIWVFTIYHDDSRDCNNIVFNFAFGALVFQYICLAVISSFVCLCSFCVGFLTARIAINIEDEKEHLSPQKR